MRIIGKAIDKKNTLILIEVMNTIHKSSKITHISHTFSRENKMKENLNDLRAFLLVAQVKSFTKAAAQLGVTQSAISHSISALENRLKIKLFHRTTRSIATTEAGEQLFAKLSPLFDEIDEQINALGEFRGTLSGSLKINGNEHSMALLWDKFAQFAHDYPDIRLELRSENRFTDIIADRFDAGIRLGDDVAKDMIAVRISPDWQMCTVASPSYLAQYGTPQTPYELTEHRTLGLRLPTLGGVLDWEFLDPKIRGKSLKVQPSAVFLVSHSAMLVQAARADLGVAWLPKSYAETDLAEGRLVEILPEWAKSYSGYFLYYPNKRENSPLLKALVAALREYG